MLGFERRVAVRFLREGRMQSVLIIVGVAAGVAVVAYISALITGLQSNTLEKTLGAQAHVTVSAQDDVVVAPGRPASGATTLAQTQPRAQRPRSIPSWAALVPVLEALPEVAAVSPMVAGAGLALRGPHVDQREVEVGGATGQAHQALRGAQRHDDGAPVELAHAEIDQRGDAQRVADIAGDDADAVAHAHAEVDGGVAADDAFARPEPRHAVDHLGSQVHDAVVAVEVDADQRDRFRGLAAQRLADDLAQRYPYKVESWQQANAQLVSALNAQSVSTGLIRGVVMVVVILGIASVLVVSVVQKRREIGILRAMGATRGQILRVFLLQGAIVGALGSMLGVLLAVVLIWAFTSFVRGSDGLPLFSITLAPALALRIAAVATLCGVLAAVAPARRAAALDPALAIRM